MTTATLKHKTNGEIVEIANLQYSLDKRTVYGNVVNDRDFSEGDFVGYFLSDWRFVEMEMA